MEGQLKPVSWMGTSLRDLRSFPREVRIDIATPAKEIDLIKRRLVEAEGDHGERAKLK
jgi:phage-related protein